MTAPDVRELLTNAGWSPGRAVDIDDEVNALTAAGYPVWQSLATFLAEFSGLTIGYTRNDRSNSVWFASRRALNWVDSEWVAEYSTRVGQQLAPVGFADHDHLMVLVGEDGRFFGGYDDFLDLLGSSPAEMISNLASG